MPSGVAAAANIRANTSPATSDDIGSDSCEADR